MAKVECEIEEIQVEFNGRMIPGVMATCLHCDHAAEAGGRSDASVRRCLLKLRETCPEGEENYNVEEE